MRCPSVNYIECRRSTLFNRDRLFPVSIILDGGGPWSEDEVLRAVQGIPWPSVPRLSVRVKVVDKIGEGYRQRTPPVNIEQP